MSLAIQRFYTGIGPTGVVQWCEFLTKLLTLKHIFDCERQRAKHDDRKKICEQANAS